MAHHSGQHSPHAYPQYIPDYTARPPRNGLCIAVDEVLNGPPPTISTGGPAGAGGETPAEVSR